ncbi:hypothetical protein ACFLS1_06720 [Verrucomicrobiota bacterium]
MKATTATDKRSEGAFCPGCERFIGPVDVCPYCEAGSARNPVYRILRYSALILGIVGLAFLYLMVKHRELPVVKVGDINSMMNYAYVRVCGMVEKDAYIAIRNEEVDYLSFAIDDGTGQLRVAAYRDVARELVEKNIVPRKGAFVDVTGGLRVRAQSQVKLILQSADGVKRRGGEGAKRRSGDMVTPVR